MKILVLKPAADCRGLSPSFFGSGGFLFQRCNLVCPALIPEAFRLLIGNELKKPGSIVPVGMSGIGMLNPAARRPNLAAGLIARC
jgi:hypothetical protein